MYLYIHLSFAKNVNYRRETVGQIGSKVGLHVVALHWNGAIQHVFLGAKNDRLIASLLQI